MTRGLLEQFCLALADATGLEVIPRGVTSYRRLIEQCALGMVDLVWLPPIPALRATSAGHVRPIALPIRDGASSYHAALFVRGDSRIRSVEDLVRLRAAWVDPQSAAGYLIIRAQLQKLGVNLKHAFKNDLFVGSHDAVAAAVTSGQADIGASYAYFHEDGRLRRAGWGAADVRVVLRAGPIPSDLIAARRGASDLLVRLIQSALVDVQNAHLRAAARLLLTADGFAVPEAQHLAPLEGLLEGLADTGDRPHSVFPPPPTMA
jgi:phosphate/phosphite/phosphonate ABC transporter binding protein